MNNKTGEIGSGFKIIWISKTFWTHKYTILSPFTQIYRVRRLMDTTPLLHRTFPPKIPLIRREIISFRLCIYIYIESSSLLFASLNIFSSSSSSSSSSFLSSSSSHTFYCEFSSSSLPPFMQIAREEIIPKRERNSTGSSGVEGEEERKGERGIEGKQ